MITGIIQHIAVLYLTELTLSFVLVIFGNLCIPKYHPISYA